MRPVAGIIAALRDGETPSPEELRFFAAGLADGRVSDAQAGAFAMAVRLGGLGDEGRVALTLGMRDTGRVLDWNLPGPVLDKHSTGGVGDCVSLLLAPALAACGAYVPMISGRGLGHTGGTLDKLEAIPGYMVDQSPEALESLTRALGCAIVGSSIEIAPADRRLYAIRDVTGTVDSLDLITASILSKKLAAGLDYLVLDVKCGNGAFLPGQEEARALAHALVETANGAGLCTTALITDMDQPLARSAGNVLEIAEVMAILSGRAGHEASARLIELTAALGGELLEESGQVEGSGRKRILEVIASGAAGERFERMVAGLGGPADFLSSWPRHLGAAPVSFDVFSQEAGQITHVDTRAIGMAVVDLGGGRRRESDRVDPRVGFSRLKGLGETASPFEPLGRVHAADRASAEAAAMALRRAYKMEAIGDLPELVQERIA